MVGDHLGMILDFEKGEFRAPTVKLKDVSVLAKTLLCRAASHKRWVKVKALACLARKAQFLHLAIPMARFFLRELHDVVKTAKTCTSNKREAYLPVLRLKLYKVNTAYGSVRGTVILIFGKCDP